MPFEPRRLYSDPALVHEGLLQYTQALLLVQSALRDPVAVYDDATFAACMVLIMYEMTECPQRSLSAYSAHLNGCARLVYLHGPGAHIDGLAHSLFVTHRLQKVRLSSVSVLFDIP